MTNTKRWLEEHFEVQKGMYFNERHIYMGNKYYASNLIEDSIWNYGIIDELTDEGIVLFESLCDRIKKDKNVYIPMFSTNFDDGILIKHGYVRPCDENGKISTETWMSFEGKKYQINKPFTIYQVETEQQKEDFVEVFLAAYGGGKTPEKPYGDLPPEYTKALIKSFGLDKFYHYICYNDGVPVSIASMCFVNGVAGLYNIGTRPEYERKGFGLAVTDACINQWLKLSGTKLFLQTETGTGIDDWYERMGFAKIFFGAIYEK